MKVVLINTAENKGGAAVACNRLHEAHLGNGLESVLIVRHKSTSDYRVKLFTDSWLKLKLNLILFYFELLILKFFKRKQSDYSLAYFGVDLQNHPDVLSADIIHLHWTQNSFISLNQFETLLKLNKPVFLTLHDMWTFTGGCHYNQDCRNFDNTCGSCPQLKNQISKKDFSYFQWKEKNRIYNRYNFNIVTPSRWMAMEASSSSLLKNKSINVVPYNINTEIFKPYDQKVCKNNFGIREDKKVILFVAMSADDKRKGFDLMMSSIRTLVELNPELSKNIELLVIGRFNRENINLGIDINVLGRLSSPEIIAQAYSAADVFIAPSLQDNLPNTVIESLACGTPAVAFDIGGMPDMIKHQENGYIAKYKDTNDLMEGIKWVFSNQEIASTHARESVIKRYESMHISNQYLNLYKQALRSI